MSWPTVAITKVARVVGGATPKTDNPNFWDGHIDWATPKDLSDLREKFISSTPRKITDAGLRGCAAEVLPVGSVLFSSRAPIGHIAINTVPMATNQGFKSFVPGPELDASFLYWWLDANRERLQTMGTGATFKEVSKAVVERIEIPLPPLDEQRRIAGILDQADALRRLRTRALDKLNSLGQAIFHEMFGDPATNPKGWPMGVIGDLLKEAKYGSSSKANSEGRGLPMLRMGNITYDGRIDLSDLKHIELSDKEFEKYTTRPGDLLFNRTNSKELVGKTAVVTQTEPMAIAGYLVRARANARGDTHYISGYLNSTHGKAVLRSMCKNIVGMANINAKEFQSIPIAIPPVELQRAYGDKLASLRAEETKIQTSLDLASTLFNSLQHRAFKGEL